MISESSMSSLRSVLNSDAALHAALLLTTLINVFQEIKEESAKAFQEMKDEIRNDDRAAHEKAIQEIKAWGMYGNMGGNTVTTSCLPSSAKTAEKRTAVYSSPTTSPSDKSSTHGKGR